MSDSSIFDRCILRQGLLGSKIFPATFVPFDLRINEVVVPFDVQASTFDLPTNEVVVPFAFVERQRVVERGLAGSSCSLSADPVGISCCLGSSFTRSLTLVKMKM
jgi:hypothetical protein